MKPMSSCGATSADTLTIPLTLSTHVAADAPRDGQRHEWTAPDEEETRAITSGSVLVEMSGDAVAALRPSIIETRPAAHIRRSCEVVESMHEHARRLAHEQVARPSKPSVLYSASLERDPCKPAHEPDTTVC